MAFKDICFIAWAITVGNETTQKGWDTVGHTGHSFGTQCDTRKRGLGCTRCTKMVLGGTLIETLHGTHTTTRVNTWLLRVVTLDARVQRARPLFNVMDPSVASVDWLDSQYPPLEMSRAQVCEQTEKRGGLDLSACDGYWV